MIVAILTLHAGQVHAQAPTVTVTTLLEGNEDTSLADRTRIDAGLRRGLREVEGVEYVFASDLLAEASSHDVSETTAILDGVAEDLRAGRAADASSRIEALVNDLDQRLASVPRSLLVDAYMLRAVTACELSDMAGCNDGFSRVIAFRESLEYDVSRYPAAHQALFETSQRALVTDGSRGSIEIRSEPDGAEVFIDGRSLGPSPAVAEGLLVGDHFVSARSLGYAELVRRVSVNQSYQDTVRLELVPIGRARLLDEDLARVGSELGQPRVGAIISSIGSYLFVNQIIIGNIEPAEDESLSLSLYLYDLRTRLLLSRQMSTIPRDATATELSAALLSQLYEGVDLSGHLRAPEDIAIEVDDPGIWEQWWFWSVVGVVVASAVVTGVVLSNSGEENPLPPGWWSVHGQFAGR